MDERDVTAQQGADLGVLDDLLDDVHEEATRERDTALAEAVEIDGSGELSPDEILRQLAAAALTADDEEDDEADDFDPIADFEDAREDLHLDPEPTADAEARHEAEDIAHGKVEDALDLVEDLSGERIQEIGGPANTNRALLGSSESEHGDTNPKVNGIEELVTTPREDPALGETANHTMSLHEDKLDAEESTEVPSAVKEVAGLSSTDGGSGDGSSLFDDSSEIGKTASIGEDPAGVSAVGPVVNNSFEDKCGATDSDLDQVADSNEQEVHPAPHEPRAAVPTEQSVSTSSPDLSGGSGDDSDDPAENVGADSTETGTRAAGDDGDVTAASPERVEPDSTEQHVLTIAPASSSSAVEPLIEAQSHHETGDTVAAPDSESQVLVKTDSELERDNEQNSGAEIMASFPAVFDDAADEASGSNRAEDTSEEPLPGLVSNPVEVLPAEDLDQEAPSPSRSEDFPGPVSEYVAVLPAGDLVNNDPEQEALSAAKREDFQLLPPPAPSTIVAVVGSMIPTSTEDDEDSDSQDEDDADEALPPPLNLDALGDDDEDELEIDPAVASTIEIEKQKRSTKESAFEATRTREKESGLLALLPGIKPTASADEIDFSFTDEIRVANVVVVPTDFSVISGLPKQQEKHEDSTQNAFGIGYTSLKKKRDGTAESAESDGYSIPTAPSFPDEKEFENELELSNDVVFSVKSMGGNKDRAGENDDDDDEFGPVAGASSSDDIVTGILEARRSSLQVQKGRDEEAIINELKRATIEEKSLNETVTPGLNGAALSTSGVVATAEPESALSLKELHGIYKRGLGDQSVLFLDESDEHEEKPSAVQPAAAATQSGANRSLSVMGRLLSKPSMLTEAITEEDEEEEDASEVQVAHADRENLIDNAAEHEDGDSAEAVDEWKEIQLTTQGSSENVGCVASEASSKNRQTRETSDSKPAAKFKISYNEAFQYCLQADEFLLQLDKIVAEDFGEGGRSCFSCFSPRPRLTFTGAMDERDRVFCIAATSYDSLDDIFTRALQTLYIKLTRTQRQVPLSGAHWEDIGFQGNDPSTDLRGCGVLSLLQMLYLIDNHLELALRFHSLSQHPTRHFPLACALINVTLQCVIALRSGALYKECNKQGSVFKAINSFYVALASELMEEIRTSSNEIPIIIKDVLEEGRSNPDRVIEEFSKVDAGMVSASSPRKQVAGGGESSTQIEFTEIALQSAASDDD